MLKKNPFKGPIKGQFVHKKFNLLSLYRDKNISYRICTLVIEFFEKIGTLSRQRELYALYRGRYCITLKIFKNIVFLII